LRLSDIAPCPSSVLIRRNLVEQVGGFEERFRGLYEDQVFFAKVCLSQPVFVSSECSARYRQHPNSNCSISQETAQHATGRLAFLRWLADYLSKDGVNNGVLRKALQREIWPYRHPNLDRIYQLARRGLPGKIWRWSLRFKCSWLSLPLVRNLRCLQFRRLQPLGYGRQRGTPIVRYYWERYLQEHQADIRGTALEIGTTYTIRKFGGVAVTRAEAIDLSPHSPEIAVVADLGRADDVPSERYDCFVNQFTMHLIYDAEAALYHAIRILKPGGVLLINFSCVDYYFPHGLDMGTGEPMFVYRWFTPIQVENMLQSLDLGAEHYTLDIYGNLFTRIAYQMNMPAEELTQRELDFVDPGHPLLICARVVKPDNWQANKPPYRDPWRPGATPARWNPETGHYAY
jgi:SAM-dependent methyltransferase